MKVVLAGNPNAGKTTLFNALTKSNLKTGNFHGVTCAPAAKERGGITYVDVPGAYSFSTYSMEEKSALDEINSADLIVIVLDALTIDSGINFAREIIAIKPNSAVYITKLKQLERRGGKLDTGKLSLILGVEVICGSPKELKTKIDSFSKGAARPQAAAPQNIPLNEAYYGGNSRFSRADRLFTNPVFAPFFFVAAVTLTFFLAFHPAMPGAVLKDLTETLICKHICGAITANLQSEPLISLLEDGVFGGAGAVFSFVPQLLVLYLCLTLLDESGITSTLAFVTDGLFEKANLSGRAAFSLVSGFGCTTAAILTTRGYSTASAQRRTVAVLPFIPCGAKLPVFLTFLSPLFSNPFPVITCFYFAGIAAAILVSLLLRGGKEGLISEVAPVTLPQMKTVLIKLCFYLKGFIIKVSGTVMLFCIVSWTLSHYSVTFAYVNAEDSMLAALSRAILPLFVPMGVHDWRIAYAALCGFVAKENIAATIALLCPAGTGLALHAALGVCTFVLFSPACVSAFFASVKEVGLKFTLKCVAAQFALAFAGGYLVNFIAGLV